MYHPPTHSARPGFSGPTALPRYLDTYVGTYSIPPRHSMCSVLLRGEYVEAGWLTGRLADWLGRAKCVRLEKHTACAMEAG